MPISPLAAYDVHEPPGDAPQRRHLVILFSDLCESTRFAARLEAEDYSDLLARLRAAYHEIVPRHGGTVAQISGDGMLALFGYPEAREGDGRRAVEAALDLHRAVAGISGGAQDMPPLRLHSGIHSGLVLLHEGDRCRGRFELLGCATNIASRLCATAGPGEILVSEATLGPERHRFDVTARRRLSLRGADTPVPTLAIAGPAEAPIVERAPLVGRAAELELLRARLADAAAGTPHFAIVEGPPGVGKTRLAEELLGEARTSGFAVHRGECDATGGPLHPFLEIARSIAAAAPAEPDGEPLPDGAAALAQLVARAARASPILLFLDDWHAADDASREAMALLQTLHELPVMVIATARPDPLVASLAGSVGQIVLAPFTAAETAEAVARLLPAADPFVVSEVAAASGGNALFIEEMCHAMAAGAEQERRQGGTPWLANLIESRFARLPREAAALVRVAAVIGSTVPGWLLEDIAGRVVSDPIVRSLSEVDFLYPGERPGTLRFKHGLTREVIYESIGLHERRALHRRIAGAIQARAAADGADEPVAALAYHYGGADDSELAADYAERAGDQAAAASALDRAQAHYRAALAALDRLPASAEHSFRWSRIAQRFGRAGVFDPSRDQLPIFRRAIDKALQRGDRADFAWAQYWLGYINYGLGEPSTAIRHWEQALETATTLKNAHLEAQIGRALGQGHAAACAYADAMPLLDAAIECELASRRADRPPIGLAYALSVKGFALGDMGRFRESHECFEAAKASIGGAQHEIEVSVLNQNGVVCLWEGRIEDALPLALEGARIAERVHSRYSHAMSRAIVARARWLIHGDERDVDELVAATGLLDLSGRGQFTSLNHGWIAEAMASLGRHEEARRAAARALLRARKRDRLGESTALRAMARIAASGGRLDCAERYLLRADAAAAYRLSPHETALNRALRTGLSGRAQADVGGDGSPAAAPPAPGKGRGLISTKRGAGSARSSRPSNKTLSMPNIVPMANL